MFSLPVGVQAICCGLFRQVDENQARKDVDVKVGALGKKISSPAWSSQTRKESPTTKS